VPAHAEGVPMAHENPFQQPLTLEQMAARLAVLEALAYTANEAIALALIRTAGPQAARQHIEDVARNAGFAMQALPDNLRPAAMEYAKLLIGALAGHPDKAEAEARSEGKKAN
jgi:hypothetical protein